MPIFVEVVFNTHLQLDIFTPLSESVCVTVALIGIIVVVVVEANCILADGIVLSIIPILILVFPTFPLASFA